jgi:creatinine amidohydrolase
MSGSDQGPAKVHYLQLRPQEFLMRLAQQPVGYLPLGSDAIISTGLFERAARRFGGIVFPPLFLGPDRVRLQPDGSLLQGMDYAEVTTPARQLEGSCYHIGEGLFLTLCENVLEQARRAGFKVIVADGHGPSRWAFGRAAAGWEEQFGLKLVSVARDFKEGWQSQMDHAALNETSLVMALCPSLVDLSRLSPDRSVWPQGVSGQDPRDATAEHGEECLEACLSLLGAKLAALGFGPLKADPAGDGGALGG